VHLQLGAVFLLRPAIAAAASFSSRTEGRHGRSRRLREATYLVASFNGLAPASSGAVGQYAAKMS
jgi:hypothetical protein